MSDYGGEKTYLCIIADTNCANSTFHPHPFVLIRELQGWTENRGINTWISVSDDSGEETLVAKIMQTMFSLRHCGPKNILKFVFCATHNGVVWSLECNLKDTKLKLKQDGDCKWKMKLFFEKKMVGKFGFVHVQESQSQLFPSAQASSEESHCLTSSQCW